MSEPSAAHPPSELFDLSDDVAVVAGAGRSIGAGIGAGTAEGLYLVAPASSWATGQVSAIDSGLSA